MRSKKLELDRYGRPKCPKCGEFMRTIFWWKRVKAYKALPRKLDAFYCPKDDLILRVKVTVEASEVT